MRNEYSTPSSVKEGSMQNISVRVTEMMPEVALAEELAPALRVSTLVHDLKMPIQVMLGWTSRLRREARDARQETIFAIIERNCQLLDELTNQLRVTLAQPEMRRAFWRAPVNLTELLACTVEGLRPAAEANHIELAVLSTSAVIVGGDVCSLTRVIANLVSNAIKFSLPGGRVECGVAAREEGAVLVVRDDGAGIGADFLPDVFEPFHREGVSSAAGSGLGLSVVRQIVRTHGGDVSVESSGRGRGCTVTVTLPYEQDE
jgi:signal transduction histidine kinase